MTNTYCFKQDTDISYGKYFEYILVEKWSLPHFSHSMKNLVSLNFIWIISYKESETAEDEDELETAKDEAEPKINRVISEPEIARMISKIARVIPEPKIAR
ncbi:33746_t:CDS:2, partial [Racocetra persica]